MASEPPEVKKARSSPGPQSSARRSEKASLASLTKAVRQAKAQAAAWRAIAPMTWALPWPRLVTTGPLAAST